MTGHRCTPRYDAFVSTPKPRTRRKIKPEAPAAAASVEMMHARLHDLEQRLARTDDQVRELFDRMDDATLERFVWED